MTIPAYDPEYYLNEPIYQVVLFCTEEEEEMYIRQFQDQIDFVRWGMSERMRCLLAGPRQRGSNG